MKLLSIEVVADVFGISRQTVGRMITEGALPAICLRAGKRKKIWRIREEQLNAWVLAHEKKSRGEKNGKA
jgi:excisionase family DNA binding protein